METELTASIYGDTEMLNQKEIASNLQTAANRASNPASSKQIWYLAKLMMDAGEDGLDYVLNGEILSVSNASSMIDYYLNRPVATEVEAAQVVEITAQEIVEVRNIEAEKEDAAKNFPELWAQSQTFSSKNRREGERLLRKLNDLEICEEKFTEYFAKLS